MSYGVVNVQAYQQEFEHEISAILFTPSLAETGPQAMPQDASGSSSASQAPKSQSGKHTLVHTAASLLVHTC